MGCAKEAGLLAGFAQLHLMGWRIGEKSILNGLREGAGLIAGFAQLHLMGW